MGDINYRAKFNRLTLGAIMCGACWNAEAFALKVQNREKCDGQEMPTMTYDTLKYNLTQEWLTSGKNQYFIFRKAVTDLPAKDKISFPVLGDSPEKKIDIFFV